MVDHVYQEHLQKMEDIVKDFRDECILSVIVISVTSVIFSYFISVLTATLLLAAVLMVLIFERRFDKKVEELQEAFKNDARSVFCFSEDDH